MKWYFWVMIGLVVVGVAVTVFYFGKLQNPNNKLQTNTKTQNQKSQTLNTVATQKASKLVFSHKIFDTEKVKYILPLGELNGGGVEMQTLNGVMVQLDRDKVKNTPIEVFAPTDLQLKFYAYIKDQSSPNGDWNVEFSIDNYHDFTINHLNNAGAIITSAISAPANENGKPVDLPKTIKIKAGELIGTTRGTSLANNWNIYLYDRTKASKNQFINQKRFEDGGYLGERFLNSACPFDYYADDTVKQSYYALLGASAPGQTKSCGSPSKDVKGALSGIWFLDQDGIKENYIGDYANPLSIYKRSDGNVIIYELGKKAYTISANKPSYKNPEEITTSHCYALKDDWGGSNKSGYAYFKIDSDTQMSLAFSPTGSCPTDLPSSATKYYR